MAISHELVLHVAELARLELDEEEVERLTRELGQILNHIDTLEALDTSGVEPTEYVAVDALPLRDDEPRPSLPHDAALDPAPRTLNEGFAVPAFVDD